MAMLKSINLENVGIGLQTIYTVPASTTSVIKEIILTNKTNGQIRPTLKFSKGSVGTVVVNPEPYFLPYETKVFGLSTFLNTGDTITIISDTASSLDIMVSLVETGA